MTDDLERQYREAFHEGAPRYAYTDDREYAAALRRALKRGSPITLEEAYGPEVARGDAVAAAERPSERPKGA